MKRRRDKIQNNLSRSEWRRCLGYWQESCCVCGSTKNICGDHWIPKSKGGSSDIDNIVPMCRKCNKQKGSSPAMGWLILKTGSIEKAQEIVDDVEQYFMSIGCR